MREYADKPRSQSRTIGNNSKTPHKQASNAEILQAYKNETWGRQLAQRESMDDEELLQAKTLEQSPARTILQRQKKSIQRVINVDNLDGDSYALIRAKILEYNETENKSITERINALSALEHTIYKWLITNNAAEYSMVEGADIIRGLMDDTKKERKRIVRLSLSDSESNPPIANIENLKEAEQNEVKNIWKSLLCGDGGITINYANSRTNYTHSGFRLNVLTEFSRLLEGEFGRSMVKEINESAHEVVIKPVNINNKSNQSFAALPTNDDSCKLIRISEGTDGLKPERYREYNIAGKDEMWLLNFFNQLKPTKEGPEGVRLINGDQTTYYKFGEGSSVTVRMIADLPDSSQYNESRLADRGEKELATPVFILLGHELGHALHMQRGTMTDVTDIPNFLTKHEDQVAYSGNREEYVNIEGNENSLRSEHDLGFRKGHFNVPYLQKEQMYEQINVWFDWLNRCESLKKMQIYQNINQTLLDMNSRVSSEWTNPKTLVKLKEDFANIPKVLKNIQLEYFKTGKHINEEYSYLMLRLHELTKDITISSLHVSIELILMEINMELDYERVQVIRAIEENRLPQYLQSLSEQRRGYSSVKFKPHLQHIKDELNDNQKFGNIIKIIEEYYKIPWLII